MVIKTHGGHTAWTWGSTFRLEEVVPWLHAKDGWELAGGGQHGAPRRWPWRRSQLVPGLWCGVWAVVSCGPAGTVSRGPVISSTWELKTD